MGNAQMATAVVTAVLVAGGIWLGAALFGAETPPDAHHAPAVDAPRDPAPAPALGSPAAADAEALQRLERRVASLENEVRVLRAALTQATEASKPLLALYEKFKEAGGLAGGPRPAAPDGAQPGAAREFVGEPMGGPALARFLAKKAGLDDKRAAAMAAEYERVAKDIERLEKENAKVEREGDTTTITIARYPSEGGRVRSRWEDWLDANLTQEERDRFGKDGGTNKLLGARLGDWSRRITITEEGGAIKLSEESAHPSGAKTRQNTEGPALARDAMLEGYLHLLR